MRGSSVFGRLLRVASRGTRRCSGAALCAALLAAACGKGGGTSIQPTQVADLTARPEDRSVLLSWSPQAPAVQFVVYFSLEPGVHPESATAISVPAPPFLHDGLENGVTVHYAVEARSSLGAALLSDEIAATPTDLGDPLFKDQWGLLNTGQQGALVGEDAKLTGAWALGYEGAGVRIAIVDDGLELAHEDLVANVVQGLSHDYVNGGTDPTGGRHGTSCAGIAAARGGNGLGIRGAAPRAGLAGYNMLAAPTVSNQADAMVRGMQSVQVSSNSWGPEDGTGDLQPSTAAWRQAIENGLANGRGGLGLIYVIAAGNGHMSAVPGGFGVMDNSNYDAFANHHGMITVGAVDDRGRRALYSERGANLLVSAPSARAGGPPGPFNHKISTTDRSGDLGYNQDGVLFEYDDRNYTRAFDGTSAAAPLVSGVAALVLQAAPDLGWRDMREILALSARRNDPGHSDWAQSPAGHWLNHDFGFGVVDAAAAVAAAEAWQPVGPRIEFSSPKIEPGLPIPDADPDGVSVLVPVSGSGIQFIEHVEVVFRSDHPFAPDLEVVLVSPVPGPAGPFVSVLAEPHDTTRSTPLRYQDWRFGSVRHLGQAADGDWTLFVADHAPLDEGEIQSVQLVFRGR